MEGNGEEGGEHLEHSFRLGLALGEAVFYKRAEHVLFLFFVVAEAFGDEAFCDAGDGERVLGGVVNSGFWGGGCTP